MSLNRFAYRERIYIGRTPEAGDDYQGIQTAFPELDILWGDGTTAGESDDYWADIDRAIGATTNDDLDLQALTGGPEGRTINFTEIRAIFVKAGTQDLAYGTATPPANVWTAWKSSGSVVSWKAGTYHRLVSPNDGDYPVSAGDKVLRVRNPGGSAGTYSILIVGATA